jgi:hypothetical protein
MEKISWTDSVKNGNVLHRVKEGVNTLHSIKERRLTGVVMSCAGTDFWKKLLKDR